MKLPTGLITTEDCRVAVDGLIDNPSRLLPSDPVRSAMDTRRDDVAAWVHGQITGEFHPSAAEIVAVSKTRHGVRPVQVWDLPSQLLYLAFSSRLAPSLPELDTEGNWSEFLRKPLSEDCQYIVEADIAACYDTIDHGLLAEELQLQSGQHDLVVTAMELLRQVGGKRYGLPQQSRASDVLAGAFLHRIERALHRKSMRVWRYTDDFRVACDDWSEVVRSIENLDQVARSHGLILNDSKTLTWKKKNYEARLNEADELMESIADEAEFDIKWYTAGPYGEPDDIEATPEEVEVLASTYLLNRWEEIAGTGEVDPGQRDEHLAIVKLIPTALSKLRLEEDELPATLNTLLSMLRLEQTLTPAICNYVASLDADEVRLEAFSRFLLSRPYLSDWQKWWLMDAFAEAGDFGKGWRAKARIAWLQWVFESSQNNAVLRAHAGLNLARHRLVKVDRLITDYDTSPPSTRPVVVSALAHLGPTATIEKAIRADSQIHEWIFDSQAV